MRLLHLLLLLYAFCLGQTGGSLALEGRDAAPIRARIRAGALADTKQHASPLSRLAFAWASQIVDAGNKRPIQQQDLWVRRTVDELSDEADQFYLELSQMAPPTEKKSLLQSPIIAAIWKLYHRQFVLTAGLRLLNTLVQFLTPVLINQLLAAAEGGRFDRRRARHLAVALFLVQCSKTVIENHYFYWTSMLGVDARAALTSSIFRCANLDLNTNYLTEALKMFRPHNTCRKLLRLDINAPSSGRVGDVNNYVQLDAARIENAIVTVHVLWDGILQAAVLTFMLYRHLGSAVLAGMMVFVLAVPLNTHVYNKLSKLRATSVKHTDQRLKVITEMLEGIYAIKAYGWEFTFMENIQDVRQAELKTIKKSGKARALLTAGTNSLPAVVSVVTFIAFALQGNVLTPSKVFTALTLLNQLRFPLTFYPMVVSHLADTRTSLARLQPFFDMPEPLAIAGHTSALGENDMREDGAVIVMKNCSFSWDFEPKRTDAELALWSTSPTTQGPRQLVDVNLNVQKGELIAVVGPVGSGKTTLLNAIMGELRLVHGESSLHGRLSYVPQTPWIPSGTIREVILFGKPYDPVLYRTAVEASGLSRDLELLADGDETEVGERGAALSGGQKQRLSIARAVYHGADLYLLDDPLSALDSAVAEKVFDKGIRGCLAGKTRIMVTNHLSVLSRVDKIILMAQDISGSMYIVDQGTYRELLSRGHDFVALLQDQQDRLAKTIALADGESETPASKESPEELRATSTATAVEEAEEDVVSDTGSTVVFASSSEESALLAATVEGSSKPFSTPEEPVRSGESSGVSSQDEHAKEDDEEVGEEASKKEDYVKNGDDEGNEEHDLDTVAGASDTSATCESGASCAQDVSGSSENAGSADVSQTEPNDACQVQSPTQETMDAAAAAAVAVKPEGLAEIPRSAKPLVKPEDRAVGGVDKAVLTTYLKAARNSPMLVMVVLFTLFANVAQLLQQMVVARWSHDPGHKKAPLFVYMGAMMLTALLTSTFNFWRVFCAFIANTRAVATLHRDMLQNLLMAPVGYFIATPAGRLLQRFARDFDQLDNNLPLMASTLLYSIFSIIVALVAVSAADPRLLLASLPIMVIFNNIARRFRVVSRDLKRLEALTRSPLYSHFGETMDGLAVIRSFNKQADFIAAHHERFTRNLAATWSLKAIDRWLSVRLESLGNLFVLLSGMSVVYAAPSAGVSGLSLTNALYITSLLNWAVRTVADTESVMTSVERVVSVIRGTPKEEVAPKLAVRPGTASSKQPARQLVAPGPYASDAELVNSGWPWRGSLTFEGVRMRYRDDLPYVLEDVTFEVQHGERIGIVGRTGSGKSSIFNALLGFAEMENGTIKIDGIDVRSIHRSTLRNAVSIIPQEPVLFSGTVRQNLDPLRQFTDERLWQALEKAKLEPTIRGMKGGLDARVNSGGMSLSTGQRQLMCLARALLRRTRILLLDEVTAAIDPDTEMLVQKTIREEFAGCTILAVAHRLHTILDSDKVIVLDAGKLVEFAPPLSLLRSRDSVFSQLLRQQQHQ